MFRAMMRFFRSIGYLLSGKVDAQTDKLQRDPTVIKANFARIVQEKKASIQEYMGAVAQLVAQEEKKTQMVKRLGDETARLRNLQAGAGGTAKERAADLKAQGTAIEVIKMDAKILQAKAAFSDFGSTIEEKESRIAELESDIRGYADRIKTHKILKQPGSLRRTRFSLSRMSLMRLYMSEIGYWACLSIGTGQRKGTTIVQEQRSFMMNRLRSFIQTMKKNIICLHIRKMIFEKLLREIFLKKLLDI